MKKIIILFLIFIFFVDLVFSQNLSNDAKEAKKMIEEAISYYKKYGLDKLIEEINNPKGIFVKGDLYLFMHNFDGLMLAHGANIALVGKNVSEWKDTDGKAFVKEFIKTAKEKGEGWVDYKWQNPVTKKIEPKTTFIKRLDKNLEIYIACGIYKKK